ncbi:MAG: ABC transporter permease [Firmicutes bacterium]|nr:ABC transporter permease [Bacillota bacterium]
MNHRDLIDLCFRNLLRRRARTILAVIGVVVGTCAIVVMLSIGYGLTAGFEEQISSYGNLHLIQVSANGGSQTNEGDDLKGIINDKTLKAMDEIDGVDAVTPIVSEYMMMQVGKKVTSTEFVGIDTEVLEKFNYEVKEGRMLTPNDKYGVLFGSSIPSWFYNPNKNDYSSEPIDVVDEKIIISADWELGMKKKSSDQNKIKYPEFKGKGVGVLAAENDESAYRVYMNIKDVEEIQIANQKARKETVNTVSRHGKTYNQAWVYVEDIDDVKGVIEVLKEDMGYHTYSPTDFLNAMQDTANMIQMVLGGIGGISLFVAALGITNTMIMSIYERTREIGVMKVIGANLKDIGKMFLIEAGLIGFGGGIIGLVVSFLISFLMNHFLAGLMGSMLGTIGSKVSIIPWYVALGALAFATFVGVAAGYIPAKRAMNLSALESLRNE